jgi:16S rRNA processing protein RimM
MSDEKNRYITVGKLGAAFGVKGWLKVHSFTENIDNILGYSPWYLSCNKKDWAPITIEDGRNHSNGIIVKFKDINTPEKARLLTGYMIAISRSQLAVLKKDEYYWTDLEGLTVINKDGSTLGKITHLIATGSNDVLVVNNGEYELLIPYLLNNTVLNVELEKSVIYVDWDTSTR